MSPQLTQAQVEELFTMTLTVNADMILQDSSQALRQRCPDAVAGARLLDVFDIHRPRGIHSFEALCQSPNTLFLLVAKDRRFALRGQMLVTRTQATPAALFLGSPWMSWISAHRPDINLAMTEYPRHDSQLDHQFYVVTQQAMVRDLETANMEARAARDEAQQARQVQSDFFAVMSHEMRTPLNGVISALDLMQDTHEPAIRASLLAAAQGSAKNLLSVINYVLDYSKLQAGKLQLEAEEFDLRAMLESALDIVAPKATQKQILLELQVAPDCPARLIADGSKLRQILLNLVSNAVKFTDTGKVTVRVTSTPGKGEDSQRLVIEVEDTGIGISPDQQAHIFDAFWTSKERTAQGESNTGLGLNICRRLADLMQGELGYRSQPGAGTCFRFSLEAQVSTRPPEASEAPAPEPVLQHDGRVLLVDDNQVNLLVGRMMLERMGLKVQTASDGYEAIALQAQQPFDLVLMDIAMPEMNGMEATRRIRARGDTTPIIALTAHIDVGRDQGYFEAGMQGVVHKPIDKNELIRALNRHLVRPAPASSAPDPAASENAICGHQPLTASDDASASDAWIDQATVEELMGDIGEANFKQALAVLLKESARRMQLLETARQDADLPQLSAQAHTLSSSLSSFGARRLGATLRQLEKAADAADQAAIEALCNQVATQYPHSHAALSRLAGNAAGDV